MPNFTRKAIKDSFWKLINEKPLNKITVKDIVEDCGINRNSFYYHFQDLPSLIEEIVEELLTAVVKDHPTIEFFEDCLTAAITFTIENKKAVFHIYNSIDHGILEKYILNMCEYAVNTYVKPALPDRIKEQDKEFLLRWCKCQCFGQIVEWLNNGMPDGILEDIHRFCTLGKRLAEETINSDSHHE